MKISVRIASDFSEGPSGSGIGEYAFENGKRLISWIQPAGEDESIGAKYSLVYDTQTGILEVERFCDHISQMTFCSGVKTRGELRTPEGHFEIEIFTHVLSIPDDGLGQAVLRYDLLAQGQEPIPNTLILSIAKINEE